MPGYTISQLRTEITAELNALQEVGVNVPTRAFSLAGDDAVLQDYVNSDLDISGLADLFCDLGAL